MVDPLLTILLKDVVLEPQEILALYASEAQLERGHTVTLMMMMIMMMMMMMIMIIMKLVALLQLGLFR